MSNVADIGLSGTIRIGSNGNNIAYAVGRLMTVKPFANANITIGYNIVGFEDRDFELARYSRSGPFFDLQAEVRLNEPARSQLLIGEQQDGCFDQLLECLNIIGCVPPVDNAMVAAD